MKRSIGLACALVVAATLSACHPAETPPSNSPPSDADVKQMEQRITNYFKNTVTLPPNVTMKLLDVAPTQGPGLLTANLELSNGTQTQKIPLVLSRDGRYMVQGQLADMTVDPSKAAMDKISLKDLPIRGNPNAPVTIVEYSDFQCPFCSRAYKTLEDQVLKDYADKVRLVFKNFPLTSIHPWAESAAMASLCVRQQNPEAFWKAYDFLFQNQKDLTADNLKEKMDGFVHDAGLDAAKFDTCFDNKATLDGVKADMQEAGSLGVRSTPTFFINGRRLEGAVPYENFKTTIDRQLEAGAPKAG